MGIFWDTFWIHTKLQPGVAPAPVNPLHTATKIATRSILVFFSYPQNILYEVDNILFDAIKRLGVFYKMCKGHPKTTMTRFWPFYHLTILS